jgi:hypothetical protein
MRYRPGGQDAFTCQNFGEHTAITPAVHCFRWDIVLAGPSADNKRVALVPRLHEDCAIFTSKVSQSY